MGVLLVVAQFGQNTSRGRTDTEPADRGQLVAVEEDGQEHTENLAGGGDGGAHQGIEFRDRVEDETLADRRANSKLQNLLQDDRVLQGEIKTRGQVTQHQGHTHCDDRHREIGPEHQIVGFRDHASFLALLLDAVLQATRESIAGEGQQNERNAERRASLVGLLTAERDDASAEDDRPYGQVLTQAVARATQKQGADHHGDRLARLGQGDDWEGEAAR